MTTPIALGDVLRLPTEPPIGSVVREEDGDEWTNRGGIWPWRMADTTCVTALDWHQLLDAVGAVVVVALPGACVEPASGGGETR